MTLSREDAFWKAKLHARLHDPAEKALVLLRDPVGHEGGTVRKLHEVLFRDGIPEEIRKIVKRADWWAAAADRPQWPRELSAQVRWTQQPILVHPLTGKHFDLKSLQTTDFTEIKEQSLRHFQKLIVRGGEDSRLVDWRKTMLAYWRFGPELDCELEEKLGELWSLLPADTRVPNHSIWDHLDLTSAFAGAFAADPRQEAALFSLTLGPVQDFIAAARTTSDLWAGSHLLARLAWEAAKVVCERLGPDAILLPRLRGVPMVDLWLRDEVGLDHDWFSKFSWTKYQSDANPLFRASMPNRLLAIVPAGEVRELACEITSRVRGWLSILGQLVVERLLKEAGVVVEVEVHAAVQVREQLEGFPEVHWSSVPFSLIEARNRSKDTDLEVSRLATAMKPFFSDEDEKSDPGFLGTTAWELLSRKIEIDGTSFYSPNRGVLYPAVYELGERVLASAKSARPFQQLEQCGWRCSLTGESEWLTTDIDQLSRSYRTNPDTLWAKLAANRPSWAKPGEHLGGLSAVKRLWPTLFSEEVGRAIDRGSEERSHVSRFVVSTHTMALAYDLESLHKKLEEQPESRRAFEEILINDDSVPALPKRSSCLRKGSDIAARIPTALDRLRDQENESDLVELENEIENLVGHKPEAYYALMLFDGDRMGQILSGDVSMRSINTNTYVNSFHPQIKAAFERKTTRNDVLKQYGDTVRAVSPSRHLAVSSALNDFALHVVPEIVEIEHRGQVIYAGGDDVMAMMPVRDLLSVMRQLRDAYSGDSLEDSQFGWDELARTIRTNKQRLACKGGFALISGSEGTKRLMRMMGGATASCGAVIAHHQSPLTSVLRELRSSEKRAKNEGNRNAFCITVMKRSGGSLSLVSKWAGMGRTLGDSKHHSIDEQYRAVEADQLLDRLQQFLACKSVSRRAVYNSLAWIRELPRNAGEDMLNTMLGYQFCRQTSDPSLHDQGRELARETVHLAARQEPEIGSWHDWLEQFLGIAEFLARENRVPPTMHESQFETVSVGREVS